MTDYGFRINPIEDHEQLEQLRNLKPGCRITVIQLGYVETWQADADGNKKIVWRMTKDEMDAVLEKAIRGIYDHADPEINDFARAVVAEIIACLRRA